MSALAQTVADRVGLSFIALAPGGSGKAWAVDDIGTPYLVAYKRVSDRRYTVTVSTAGESTRPGHAFLCQYTDIRDMREVCTSDRHYDEYCPCRDPEVMT